MKQHNHQHLDLPMFQFTLPGIEVTELHGTFANAQWYSAVDRLDRERERKERQWTRTTQWMAPPAAEPKTDPALRQWTDTIAWRVPKPS